MIEMSGRTEEALPNLIEGHAILLTHLGPDAPGILDLNEKIAAAYETIGDAASAAQWRATPDG